MVLMSKCLVGRTRISRKIIEIRELMRGPRLFFRVFSTKNPAVQPSQRNIEEHLYANPRISKDIYQKEYEKSLRKPEDFWHEAASALVWEKKYEKVLENSKEPFTKWFVGGKISVCYNAVDRHVDEGFGRQVALIHESPVTGSTCSITYQELLNQVTHLAGYLRSIGVKKGDRVIIYMPMIPEAVVAMLACSRLGAIHSVVFGGFAAKELATRVSHAKAYAVICGSHGIERGRQVDYKKIVDDAVELAEHKPKHTIVFQRPGLQNPVMVKGRDLDWNEAISSAKPVDCVAVDANDPLYILYTSGTTGTPKAVVRPAGGYAVVLNWSMYNILGMRPGHTWWAASDFGWVVGHSYICYGPLLHRNKSVVFEGKPTGTPDGESFFRVIEKHQVQGMFAAPTSIRAIRQEDPEMKYRDKHNIASLKYLFLAGEHCDEETKLWAKTAFQAPALDNWWQTETGWPVTSTCVGLGSSLNPPPHTSGHAVPGYDIRVVETDTGKSMKPDELGRIVIKLPLPPGTFSNLWEDEKKFNDAYFTKYPGYYDTMDAGSVDSNGYVSVLSRMDDIINVSGCRISTSALEEAILRHPDVADCAVVGVKDQMKGQVPVGFIVLTNGHQGDQATVVAEVIKSVRNDIGPICAFKSACIVPKLPKTRSGKIARPSLIDLAENRPLKIPITIEDAGVYPEIKVALQAIGYAR